MRTPVVEVVRGSFVSVMDVNASSMRTLGASPGTSPLSPRHPGGMVALRSARLEALLGSDLEQVQYSQLMTLISNQVAEAFDLDFKSEMYGSSDRDKRDAATDVAALANTAGGLVVLGVEEDGQASCSPRRTSGGFGRSWARRSCLCQ